MNIRVTLIIVALLSIPLMYSVAFASTSAELTRTSTVNVDTDENGVIALTPNPDYKVIQVNETLSIDPQNVGANSMNTNASLILGNTQDPSQTDAFTVQNRTSESITLDISLEETNQFDATSGSVTYYISDSGTVTPISVGDTTSIQLDAGEEAYVAVQIDSTGTAGNLTTNLVIKGGKA